MAKRIDTPIKTALAELRRDRDAIDRKIAALENALAALSGSGATRRGRAAAAPVKRRKRKPLTDAQKKAISKRMKAAWARRKRAAKAGA